MFCRLPWLSTGVICVGVLVWWYPLRADYFQLCMVFWSVGEGNCNARTNKVADISSMSKGLAEWEALPSAPWADDRAKVNSSRRGSEFILPFLVLEFHAWLGAVVSWPRWLASPSSFIQACDWHCQSTYGEGWSSSRSVLRPFVVTDFFDVSLLLLFPGTSSAILLLFPAGINSATLFRKTFIYLRYYLF